MYKQWGERGGKAMNHDHVICERSLGPGHDNGNAGRDGVCWAGGGEIG